MSWNVEAQQAVPDCGHSGNCPCRPEACDVCAGTGLVIFVRHRPLAWTAKGVMSQSQALTLREAALGYVIGTEQGEERECPECHGEESVS